jgi:dihydrofolate synthase/folylpolyglutamate synthase
MPTIRSFQEANKVLEQFWPLHLQLQAHTLEHIEQLLDFLDNPQDKLHVVHVAGTSGKTSTSYYAAALLRAAGKKVGLTIGPHLQEINERVQLNGQPLDEATFCRDLGHFLDRIAMSGVTPTYFELMVAFAFTEFATYGMEYAVVEVGMGGLEDPSNVVSREDKVCIIADIGYDHMRHLGETLPEIATHKAGIIQLHNTVFCHVQSDDIMTPIRERSRQKQADLHILSAGRADCTFDFLPLFQRRNFTLALAAIQFTLQRDATPLSDKAINQAAHISIPGRMEILHIGGKTVVLDGAHNPQKMQLLMESMRERFGDQHIAALVSFSSRLARGTSLLRILHKHVSHISTTTYGTPSTPYGSITPRDMHAACQQAGVTSYEPIADPHAAVQLLLARPEPVLLVTGSFFLLHDVRPALLKRAMPRYTALFFRL